MCFFFYCQTTAEPIGLEVALRSSKSALYPCFHSIYGGLSGQLCVLFNSAPTVWDMGCGSKLSYHSIQAHSKLITMLKAYKWFSQSRYVVLKKQIPYFLIICFCTFARTLDAFLSGNKLNFVLPFSEAMLLFCPRINWILFFQNTDNIS